MLTIVRHGRTTANRERRLLGRLDVPLDDLGVAQARTLAEAVGPVDRIISSPLARTRQTAEAWGQDVEVDDRWIELDYGDFDGSPLAAIAPETWRRWRADTDFAPPGGESLADLGARVRAACDDLRAVARDEHVVVVTHVSPIKAAVGWAVAASDEVAWRLFVAPASITRIDMTDRVALHAFNVTTHLDGLED